MLHLSIIIPCFNRIVLLKDTLTNLAQAIQKLNVEIILVDDGSEIPIADQIKDFEHLPLKHIRQLNSGLTASRYNGMLAASGKYLLFLDSDDQVHPDKLVKQIAALEKQQADVCYTDHIEKFKSKDEIHTKLPYSTNPAVFYIQIQPPPHSPIFKTSYLKETLKKSFIPLSRDFDSIGEVWFYYNLSVFDAKIVKVNEPLTWIIHHENDRLTNHWERLGLCALSLKRQFVKHYPTTNWSEESRRYVGLAAWGTYRGLPFNIYKPLQRAFLDIWRQLGKPKPANEGRYFRTLSKMIGRQNAAQLYKIVAKKDYQKIKTISEDELVTRTEAILAS